MNATSKPGISTWGAAFLGIGSMVGAGVFALLGQAGAIAGAAVWVAFLIGGIVAGMLGYVVTGLGIRYPASGGVVVYLQEAFGDSHITGFSSWMYYFAIIIVTSMVAVSFGNYGSQLFFGASATALSVKLLTTAIVLITAVVSVIGAKLLSRVQSVIVLILLAVFAVFIVATFSVLKPELLAPANYPPLGQIMPSVALTFFAYLGFAVITFSAGDMADARRQLPRAMVYALGLTGLLYILLSLGVFGSLTVEEVIQHGDTALAYAAIPALGQAGFAMMAVAALLATASSVNAYIYGVGNMAKSLAKQRQFPPVFGSELRTGATWGLVISVVVILILANVFDLSAIANMGSAISLALFLMLMYAAFRLRAETGTHIAMIVGASLATAIVLVVFLIDLLKNDIATVGWLVVFSVLALVIEFAWKAMRGQSGGASPDAGGSSAGE